MGHPVTAAGRNLLRDGSAGRITNDALRIRILAIEAEAAQDAARQRDELRLPIRRCGHCNSWLGVAKEHECHREDTVIDAILSEYAILRATEGKHEPRHTEGQGEVCDPSCPHWDWAALRATEGKQQ